jgi:methylmalonyl-CoA/ethylmalonyl-CoA epimerase
MSEKKTGKMSDIKQENLCQIGIVVKSVDETVKYFQDVFGFHDFEIRNVDFPTATYYGKPAGYKGKRGFFNMGPIQIELIECISGKTIQEDFIKENGEGLHHIQFKVEDLKAAMANAEKAGLHVIQSYVGNGIGFAYIDSDKVGGVIFEMGQQQKKG